MPRLDIFNIPKDATIRFLDTKPPEPIWIKIHEVEIAPRLIYDCIEVSEDFPYYKGSTGWVFNSETKDWIKANLRHQHVSFQVYETDDNMRVICRLSSERDAILFKVKFG